MRKKIQILGPLPPTVGGITTLIEGILDSDISRKYDLSLFDTQRPTYGLYKDVWDYTLLLRLGFTNLIKSALWTFSHLITFPFTIMKKRPDIVHINTASYWAFWENAIYVLTSKILNRKVILHIHGGGFEDFYASSNIFFKFLLKETLMFSDKIVVLSLSWKSLIKSIVPDSKVSIIENFVNFPSNVAFKKPIASKKNFVVLFVGGPGAKLKGLFDVVDAASIVTKKVKDVLFVLLACSGVKDLRKICQAKGLGSNVKILGYRYGSDKAKVFFRSDIFILPSYAEGLPITMLEAMATGLPVIATPTGAIPDIIKVGMNGFLVKVGDYSSLAERILFLKNAPALRMQMAENNFQMVRENFEKTVIIRKLDTVYSDLL